MFTFAHNNINVLDLLAFMVDDFEAAYALHKEMGIVCCENPKMGISFIEDPDGYWDEIVPGKK